MAHIDAPAIPGPLYRHTRAELADRIGLEDDKPAVSRFTAIFRQSSCWNACLARVNHLLPYCFHVSVVVKHIPSPVGTPLPSWVLVMVCSHEEAISCVQHEQRAMIEYSKKETMYDIDAGILGYYQVLALM